LTQRRKLTNQTSQKFFDFAVQIPRYQSRRALTNKRRPFTNRPPSVVSCPSVLSVKAIGRTDFVGMTHQFYPRLTFPLCSLGTLWDMPPLRCVAAFAEWVLVCQPPLNCIFVKPGSGARRVTWATSNTLNVSRAGLDGIFANLSHKGTGMKDRCPF
jgi:hypothetical protein